MPEEFKYTESADRVVTMFRKIIPREYMAKIYQEYKEGIFELSLIIKNDPDLRKEYMSLINTIYAISVCYRNVIKPFKGAASLFEMISEEGGGSSISFGRESITIEDANDFNNLTSDFDHLLRVYHLSTFLFEYENNLEFYDKTKKHLISVKKMRSDNGISSK